MLNLSANNYIKHILLAFLVFYTVMAQGGFFVIALIVLNIFFLFAIVFGKENIKWDMAMVLFCGLFGIMAISSIFSFSFDAAVKELLKYALFPLAYGFFQKHIKDQRDGDKIRNIFYGGFVILMVFGMLGILGLSPIDGMVTNLGGRLQSFFQYANTTALAMGIGGFYATEKFRNTKKWFHLIMAALFFVALILTLSRVGFVIFVLCYLLYVFQFIKLKIKILLLGGLGGLMAILVATSSRIAQISIFAPTLVERYISYFDALGMMARNPFGIGLGNWQFLQFYYQSAPYQVFYIHNAYLQIGLDGGFLALLIFLVAIGIITPPTKSCASCLSFCQTASSAPPSVPRAHVVVASLRFDKNPAQSCARFSWWSNIFVKTRKCIHFYIGIFILISSFFEVHFNFGIIIIYFMFLLAMLNRDKQSLKVPKIPFGKYVKYTAFLPIAALMVLLVSNILVSFGTHLESRGQTADAYRIFTNAHNINPLSDELYINKARTSPEPHQALQHLYAAHNINNWNTLTLYMLAQNHIILGNFEEAFTHADNLLEIFPFGVANQNLLREIIGMFEYESRANLFERLERRIEIINNGINPLFRHISADFSY